MYGRLVCFVAGVLLQHTFGTGGYNMALLACLAAGSLRRWLLPAMLLLGFGWAGLVVYHASRTGLPRDLEGLDIQVEGRIETVEQGAAGEFTRFRFSMRRLDAGQGWRAFPATASLNWYAPAPSLQAGEDWVLRVRLKRPHGFANPGGFDYERWLFQQGIRATGYVRTDAGNHCTGRAQPGMFRQFRTRLVELLAGRRAETGFALLQALTVGDRSSLTPTHWSILSATGTSHLMAISGLHVSLVAGLGYALMRRIWGGAGRLVELLPVARVAGVAGLLAASGYALLSGLGIPARRALLMIGLVILARLFARDSSFPQQLLYAAVFTLLIDPLSALSAGWWLSFWAVLLLAWTGAGRVGSSSVVLRSVSIHLLLAIGMLPPMLLLFQQVSLIAPLANLVAVPVVGILVLPLALLGVVLFAFNAHAGDWMLSVCAAILEPLWHWLTWLAQSELAYWVAPMPAAWTLLPALAGLALILAPRGVPGRFAGCVLMLPMLLLRPERPEPGAMQVALLDVGQGLSAVVETASHVLVFDTGPAFSPDFDTGRVVIIPYLRWRGIDHLDTLVISHGDNDHIGGASSLLSAYPADRLLSSTPAQLSGYGASRCRDGMNWDWDSVHFTLLHPDAADEAVGNNQSCVLLVESAGGGRILLTGDIEREGERELLQRHGPDLQSGLLVVPHHGSNTSSTRNFLAAVAAQVALVPAGYLNRYRFPRPEVVERYRQSGAVVLDTGHSGAITASFSAHASEPQIHAWRDRRHHYWQWHDP